ncbi:amidohydrolase family protein [Nonomuraea typhae]|uniref:amidohydrolase family protein n=1 Tax=Nonomuraea typhae TaxID=2603600 RepID=UPI0012F9562A|nr:amidohydrolase family protein [Nonomuraea typhae]
MFTLRARRLFDGHELYEDRVVTIDGDRIAAVSGPGRADLDLGAATLLPGLIDCHVHLAFDAGPDPVAQLDRPGLATRMRQAAKQHLLAGVTTVRDLGDRDYMALGLGLGPAEGPEILAAGPPITTSGGHCWWLGGQADGESAVRAAVRERAGKGVHVIKVMVTGGQMTEGSHPHRLQYGPAELTAAVAEAHAAGLPAAAHAHSPQGIAHALRAGFDTIEHCAFWTENSVEPDPRTIAALADSPVVVSMTAGIVPVPGLEVPAEIRARWPKTAGVLRELYAAGVTFVIGSDAGIAPIKPHGLMPHAVRHLVDLGFQPLDVLRASTSVAAGACRVGARKGRIAPGFDADLLAVAGDPLADVTSLLRPLAVYRMGQKV